MASVIKNNSRPNDSNNNEFQSESVAIRCCYYSELLLLSSSDGATRVFPGCYYLSLRLDQSVDVSSDLSLHQVRSGRLRGQQAAGRAISNW